MTLPESGAPWPPPERVAPYREMRVDDAWYSGDRARLARVYDHHQTYAERRKLWGRRPNAERHGQQEQRLHMPLPGDIARTSADLLFADMPEIIVDDKATRDRLDVLLDEGQVQATLLGAAEQAAALSGVFLRVTWDRELADRPLLTVCQPDGAVPEFRYGITTVVTFWRELSATEHVVFRHFERHEPGRILHTLYEGTPDNVGRAVPLTEHPETAELVDSLDGDGVSISTGIRDLTAAYIPNMLPNRLHRGSPLGRSDFAKPLPDLFDALDETWSSWMRDIREVWTSLRIPPTEDNGITLAQFAIRVEEHQRTAEATTREAVQAAGYSAQSFGLDRGGQAITATEVDSRDARSMVTRKKKAGYWRHSLTHMLHVLLQIDASVFGQRITPLRPRVEFGDSVAESEQQTATTLDLLNRAGAVSTKTKVKILHPEWDDDVQTEVDAILTETGAAALEPLQANVLL
ncbi:phage portal protein [Streptomyces boncukensis]|uniref:Phage capsid protein n=1 Tax=Streptomyces boncukensis TaxID=2711219 RepID=A0A6G4WQT6_9ACTN|nr:phage portal protein [Streptomyces boncukensis]NGO67626.1 phage capsid protein [Streptomyces boncukensis]